MQLITCSKTMMTKENIGFMQIQGKIIKQSSAYESVEKYRQIAVIITV